MNAGLLKTEALCWLRFTKQLDFVCTEGGYWSADVLGAGDEFVIEIEVKTSRADLLAEFRNKKAKHAYYQTNTNWAPNYFYVLVPQDLAPEAIEILKEKMPKAGVLAYAYPNFRHGERLKVMRKAQKLHNKKPFAKLMQSIKRRAASELCGLHLAMDRFSDKITIEQIQQVKDQILDAIAKALGDVNERTDAGLDGCGIRCAGEHGEAVPSDSSASGVRLLHEDPLPREDK